MKIENPKVRAALLKGFHAHFGPERGAATAPPRLVLSPGRVNLIGEHTDYNGGLVLPMAIDRHTAVVFRPVPERRLRVWSAAIAKAGGRAEETIPLGDFPLARRSEPALHWANYLRGVAQALRERGVMLRGGDLYIDNDLPAGAGLSSSASLELGVALALLALAGARRLKASELAKAGQEAEHRYAGVKCGLMDQTIVALGREGHALLLDCRDLATRQVPLALGPWAFAVFDTGVRHSLAASEYNVRGQECRAAARKLRVPSLRAAGLETFLERGDRLGEREYRRARHVFTENQRVAHFARLLGRGEIPALGRLLCASHESLRDDYQVSCRELDLLVDTLCEKRLSGQVAGARMVGGGFGGSVLALLRRGAFEEVRAHVARRYRSQSGRALGGCWLVGPSAGAGIVSGAC